MKYMTLIVLFGLFSCGATKKQASIEKETLVFFSKGSCLGNCPVYDITIHTDGSYRFFGVKKVKFKGEKKGELSKNQQAALNLLLTKNLNSTEDFRKVRDKPITVLKYKGETSRFYSFKTTTERGALNNWFNDFVESIE